MSKIINGKAYVVRDNIDTDQIIPAQYLTLVPTIPEEYEKLGSYAMAGLPDSSYPSRFIKEGQNTSEYPILIAGRNFGCGSSREHAPIALGASGLEVVVAESFARIFFRNSVATGELYPYESTERVCDLIQTGDEVAIHFDKDELVHPRSGRTIKLKPLGDVRAVVDAGGLFDYARQTGMIGKR
jgi:3-isopropylmalate/(R)-2-methylmalate dehydratase small subunit